MGALQFIFAAEIAAGLLAGLFFVVRFAFTRWWRTAAGMAMMGLYFTLTVIFGLWLPARLLGPLPPVVWVVVLAVLVSVLWTITIMMWRSQRRGKDGTP